MRDSQSQSTGGKGMDLNEAAAEVLVESHYRGELWGLATNPLDADLVATVGDDGLLCIWSIKGNCALCHMNLGFPARSVAWHPLGSVLAVGFYEREKGGYSKRGKQKSKKPKKNVPEHAVWLVSFSEEKKKDFKIEKIAECCDSVAWICDLKFSPTGNFLGAASHDKRLYFYDVPDIAEDTFPKILPARYKENGKDQHFNKHSSAVLHFDFSSDEAHFQSNCQAAELLFGKLSDTTLKQETSATKVAKYNNDIIAQLSAETANDDEKIKVWHTQTCTLSWPTQGIWPSSDTTEVNACDRSSNGKIIATADDSGQVRLFRFPCASRYDKKSSLTYGSMHSSHVTNVRWTINDTLVSTGGNDKCIFVWGMTEK